MKINRECTDDEVEEIHKRLSKKEYNDHADRCTPALCLCGTGKSDGTPMPSDYKKAHEIVGHILKDNWMATILFDVDINIVYNAIVARGCEPSDYVKRWANGELDD